MKRHKCIGVKEDGTQCKKYITYRFAICSDCEKIYGSIARNWPAWLRYLWNDIQRERRKDRAWESMTAGIDDDTFDADRPNNAKVQRYRPAA